MSLWQHCLPDILDKVALPVQLLDRRSCVPVDKAECLWGLFICVQMYSKISLSKPLHSSKHLTLYHSSLLLCSRCILPLDAWSNKETFSNPKSWKQMCNVNSNLMMMNAIRKTTHFFSESSSLFSHSETWVSPYYLVFYKSLHANEPMGPPENQRSSDSHITCWELFDYPTHEAWVWKMGWCFSFSHGNCWSWLVFARTPFFFKRIQRRGVTVKRNMILPSKRGQ